MTKLSIYTILSCAALIPTFVSSSPALAQSGYDYHVTNTDGYQRSLATSGATSIGDTSNPNINIYANATLPAASSIEVTGTDTRTITCVLTGAALPPGVTSVTRTVTLQFTGNASASVAGGAYYSSAIASADCGFDLYDSSNTGIWNVAAAPVSISVPGNQMNGTQDASDTGTQTLNYSSTVTFTNVTISGTVHSQATLTFSATITGTIDAELDAGYNPCSGDIQATLNDPTLVSVS